jgi:hypothetical protein
MRLRTAAAYLTLAGLAACAAPMGAPRPSISYPAAYTDNGIEVVVDGTYRNGYGQVLGISGTARNVSNIDRTFCQVEFGLLDQTRAKVSGALANTSSLRAGQTWRFQAIVTSPYPVVFTEVERGLVTVMPVPRQR